MAKKPHGNTGGNPLRREGVRDKEYEKAVFDAEQFDMARKITAQVTKLNDEKKKGTILDDILSGNYAERLSLTVKQFQYDQDIRDLKEDDLKTSKIIGNLAGKFGEQVKNQLPFVSDMNDSYKSIKGNYAFLGKFAGPIAAFGVLAKLAYDFAQGIADTRKELGVSVVEAGKLNLQNKKIYWQAKLYMITQEEINSAQAAIRENLGASVSEAASLSLNFARTSAATGQTSENLASTLMIMESISTASRDTLLNQIRSNAAMIQAAGVAPSLVMEDIAQNSEFFATYAQEGGKNLIQAGIAARKLGTDMNAVKNITEGLMDFESSIEASMHASQLLGREINTDRARMLAMTGKTEELMREVQRLVGSEAQFTEMLAPQREALAKAFNMDVETLSRFVRNQGPQAAGTAAGGAMNNIKITPSADVEAHRLLGKIARNTE